jgi:hypothetical protein
MRKVLAKILPHGILSALSQYVLRASELGFFENRYCFRCQQHGEDFPEFKTLFNIPCYDILFEILPTCTGQNFFQTLCTRFIESTLLQIVWTIVGERCVFVFDFWK